MANPFLTIDKGTQASSVVMVWVSAPSAKMLTALCSSWIHFEEDVHRLMYWGIEGEDYYVENGHYGRTPEQAN